MNIVVAVRCLNESKNIERFLEGYSFADRIVVSDGGSTDGSIEMLQNRENVELIKFDMGETINGEFWNMDAPHMNFVLDHAKNLEPDILIFDDMDCVPTAALQEDARNILEHCALPQINAFRLYLWGDDRYFPKMNNHFDPAYTSLWAFKPKEIDIHADMDIRHGTLVGLHSEPLRLGTPYSLLHKSWHPDTIDAKIRRYNALGLPFSHPLEFAGAPEPLPTWAVE